MLSLYEGAKKVIKVCADLKSNESALIITDDNKLEIAKMFWKIINEIDAEGIMIIMQQQKLGGQEPPATVSNAMCKADVIFGLTTYSLSQTDARIEATRCGARIINIPDVQKSDLTARLIEADFVSISPKVKRVAEKLTAGNKFKVTSLGGTDLTFDGTGRIGQGLDALSHEPGTFRSLSVEANIGPLEGTSKGIIVIDGSLPPVGPLDMPIKCKIEKGKIVDISGGEKAKEFENFLTSFNDPNIYMVAELGIGLNPKAILTGKSYLEDESAINTCHFGFGSNMSQGGNIVAAGHFDAMIKSPTIVINGEIIIKGGEVLI